MVVFEIVAITQQLYVFVRIHNTLTTRQANRRKVPLKSYIQETLEKENNWRQQKKEKKKQQERENKVKMQKRGC